MHTISKLEVKKAIRKGESGNGWTKQEVKFADIIIDNKSLFEIFVEKRFDYVSCLGWSFADLQQKEINKLLLKGEPDFDNGRYAIFICPECGDLGCGAISVDIKKDGDLIVWRDFGVEDNLGILGVEEVRYKNLEELGPFYFKYEQYDSAINDSFGLGELIERKEN